MHYFKKNYKGLIYLKSTYSLVMERLGIGNKESDVWTREEYNKLIEEAGIVDINSKKKDWIQ